MLDPALSRRLIDQEARFAIPASRYLEAVATRADGVFLWDLEGNRIMDFVAADGAASHGHNHTRIAATLVEQSLRLSLTSQALRHDRLAPFLEKLCTLTGFDQAHLLSTGSEAVEAALLAARRWAGEQHGLGLDQTEILIFSGNCHGHTSTLLGCQGPADRCPPGFRQVPFGDLGAARAAVGPQTCAILVEPVQGHAGVIVPPKGFLKGLRELCDRQGILLLVDEVQSGLGRTGKWLACQHEAVRADAVVLGKALGAGFYPISAVLGNRPLMTCLAPRFPSSYGGNPLACAVASAALDVLMDERLMDRAAELGAYFLEQLRAIDSPRIQEVRGIGLWAGIGIRPEAGPARRLAEDLLRQGLLCLDGPGNSLRLSPPLTITREQVDWAVDQLKAVLEA